MNTIIIIKICTIIFFTIIFIPTCYALFSAPYVPTPKGRVLKMLKVAKLKKGQKTYELGCGDARLTCFASKEYKAKAVGFEFSPLVFLLAKIRNFISRSHADIKFQNFYKADFRNADAIFCYLLPSVMQKLSIKFKKELKKGTKIISYAFPIKGWKEVSRIRRNRQKNFCPIWVYEIGKE